MGEQTVSVSPESPWDPCNCVIMTPGPSVMTVSNVPLITVPEETATGGDEYRVRKDEHPGGLIVVPEHNKPDDNVALMPVIFTESDEIILPLHGWPRGGGVIFL